MAETTESGFKWWMRYVVVPIIGGGGIIAIVIALMSPRPENVKPSGEGSGAENVEFYIERGNGTATDQNYLEVPRGETVTVHWKVSNPRGVVSIIIKKDLPDGTIQQITAATGVVGSFPVHINQRQEFQLGEHTPNGFALKKSIGIKPK